MTVETWTRTPEYTVAGIGPYAITHPYASGAIRAQVVLPAGLLVLSLTEYSLTPAEADIEGNLFLSPAAAATHAGRKLIIDRMTPDEQGWLATQGEREQGLMVQLDRMVQASQELRAEIEGALRIRGGLATFDWSDGTVPLRDGTRVISGPTAAEIAAAQTHATNAGNSASAAAASAAEALARELSMLRDRGDWVTALFYSPSDIVTINGSAYICIQSHFATVFATDLATAKWRVFAQQGAAGPGSGDMTKAELLSGLSNYPQARANMGLGALATKNLAAFSDLDPTAVISDVEGLAANKVANAVPVAKAVTDYVDYQESAVIPTTSGTEHTITGAPDWANRIELLLDRPEITTNNLLVVRLGTSGGIVTTGYTQSSRSEGITVSTATDGFYIITALANSRGPMGRMIFTREDGNIWLCDATLGLRNFGSTAQVGGRVDLGDTLTQIRLLRTTAGNFNAGAMRARYFRN